MLGNPPISQAFSARNCLRGNDFSGSIPTVDFFFFPSFCFFSSCFGVKLASSAHVTKAQTKLRQPQYLRTSSKAEQPAIGPAQSSEIMQQYFRVDQSATTQAGRQGESQVLSRATMYKYSMFPFFLFCFCQNQQLIWIFPGHLVPLTLIAL